MANVELKPARVFEQFAKINQIPRPSKHEEQMIAYLQKFAEERGLAVKVDKTGNERHGEGADCRAPEPYGHGL